MRTKTKLPEAKASARPGRTMMKKGIFGGVTAAAALFSVSSAIAGARNLKLEPGKYVLTITYEVQDQRQNEPRTATRCITPGDLDDPERIFNDQAGAPAGSAKACSVRNLRSTNQRVSYDADCPNRTVHVDGNVSGDGFSVVRTVRPKGNSAVSLRFTVRGTRTGDCSER
ncbi:MAG TPA: DUF3617 family protein [Candidatus Acidoferrales bacterium]|nr:DUF3617 family protein [Candidatus Acidoferrales bacterium]